MPLNLDLERCGHGSRIVLRFPARVVLLAALAACSTEQDAGTPWHVEVTGGASTGDSPDPRAGHAGAASAAGHTGDPLTAGTGANTTGGTGHPTTGGAGSDDTGGAAGTTTGTAGTGGTGASGSGTAGASETGGVAGAAGGVSAGEAGVSGAGPEGGGAGAAGCPDDMVAVAAFCMDRFEAPNEPGASPLAMQTAPDGEAWCAARGKELCSEAQWLRACEGTAHTTYPYGNKHEEHRCNDDKTWISPDWTTLASWPSEAAKDEAAALYQADPSGSRTGCLSVDGVADLTGNVAEWTRRSFATAKNYDHVLKGCYWSECYGGSKPTCGFVNGAHPGTFRTYEAGFRCCLGPDP